MKINVQVTGLQATIASLSGQGKQVRYAASRAINNVAFGLHKEFGETLQRTFTGTSPWTRRAMSVDRAQRDHLVASVGLRPDGAGGNYQQVLGHLFRGGRRRWKGVEGALRAINAIPDGMMAVPGLACPLDGNGNIRKAAWDEMLGALRSNIRNVRVHKGGTPKAARAVGYFVLPQAYRGLHPGIWQRIERGRSSVVRPMIAFVRPGNYRRFIDLEAIARPYIARRFQPDFERELSVALRNAK